MNVRIEYNQDNGNFHFDDITNEKVKAGHKLISPNIKVEKAIEFTHHISTIFECFKHESESYPKYSVILKEFNNFVRK